MTDVNSIGHNVVEIGEIEIESLFNSMRTRAVALIRGHRLRAESSVYCVTRSHIGCSLCLFVVETVVRERIEMSDSERGRVEGAVLLVIYINQYH